MRATSSVARWRVRSRASGSPSGWCPSCSRRPSSTPRARGLTPSPLNASRSTSVAPGSWCCPVSSSPASSGRPSGWRPRRRAQSSPSGGCSGHSPPHRRPRPSSRLRRGCPTWSSSPSPTRSTTHSSAIRSWRGCSAISPGWWPAESCPPLGPAERARLTEAVVLLRRAASLAPESLLPPVLTVAALFEQAVGRAACARLLLGAALEQDRDYALAGLIARLAAAGQRPHPDERPASPTVTAPAAPGSARRGGSARSRRTPAVRSSVGERAG